MGETMKHRINVTVRSLFGTPIDGFAVDTFGTREDAKKVEREYRQAMRADYGWLCHINSNVQTTKWEAA